MKNILCGGIVGIALASSIFIAIIYIQQDRVVSLYADERWQWEVTTADGNSYLLDDPSTYNEIILSRRWPGTDEYIVTIEPTARPTYYVKTTLHSYEVDKTVYTSTKVGDYFNGTRTADSGYVKNIRAYG